MLKPRVISVVLLLLVVAGGLFWQVKRPVVTEEELPVRQQTEQKSGEVLIKRNLFVPEQISIKVGETVTWINEESYAHDVVSETTMFKSPKMATGEKFSYTFSTEGTYAYYCGIHPFMRGTVVVSK